MVCGSFCPSDYWEVIKFTGTGEKITDIETFHPDRMSGRILGMGDMLTLIEKASQEYDENARLNSLKGCGNTASFNDFIDQLDQKFKTWEPMEDLLEMLPGTYL